MNSSIFVGVIVDQKTNPDSIWVGQLGYIHRALTKDKIDEAKRISTPVDANFKLVNLER